MRKTAILMLFAICVATASDSYIIEAEGEFGRELKAVIEKYAKDANATVNIKEKPAKKESESSFFSIGVDTKRDGDASAGEELYNRHCRHCHGQKGEKRAMGSSQKLIDMSAEDIAHSVRAYGADPQFGGRMRHIMQPSANAINSRQLGDIIAFIKGEGALKEEVKELKKPNSTISTEPSEQGSYLK